MAETKNIFEILPSIQDYLEQNIVLFRRKVDPNTVWVSNGHFALVDLKAKGDSDSLPLVGGIWDFTGDHKDVRRLHLCPELTTGFAVCDGRPVTFNSWYFYLLDQEVCSDRITQTGPKEPLILWKHGEPFAVLHVIQMAHESLATMRVELEDALQVLHPQGAK